MVRDRRSDGLRQFSRKLLRVKFRIEIKQPRQVWSVTGRLQQHTAVLKYRTHPPSLGTPNNLVPALMDDIVGIASQKAEEMFGRLRGPCRIGCTGIAPQPAGGMAANQEINQREVHFLVEL
jgi:hypothetical protein